MLYINILLQISPTSLNFPTARLTGAVTQHTTACCSTLVVDITFTDHIYEHHIPQNGTTETLRVHKLTYLILQDEIVRQVRT